MIGMLKYWITGKTRGDRSSLGEENEYGEISGQSKH